MDTSDEGGIGLNAILLNQKDWFTMQVVLTNFNGTIKLHGRIVGVPSIRRVERGALLYRNLAILALPLIVSSVLLAALTTGVPRDLVATVIATTAGVIASYSLVGIYAERRKRSLRM
jgi:hypothetical protein